MENKEQIGVSVYCTVYNHEKYLRQCLDGFVMQKTTFPFEVIIHDDASTDHSVEIIREYTQNYPNIFRPIYQTVNQYSQGINIVKTHIFPMVRGKYLAVCEGDDYWCDESKLQQQYDIMESNPDCHLCVHRVKKVNEVGEDTGRNIPCPEIRPGRIPKDRFIPYVLQRYPFQTSCYFRRTEDVRQFFTHEPEFNKVADVGDVPIMLYYGSLGDSYYINETFSCYRVNSVGSWNARIGKNEEMHIKHLDAMIDMYELFDEFSEHKYTLQVNKAKKKIEIIKNQNVLDDRAYAQYLMKKENREAFREEYNIKGRIYIILRAYVPHLVDIYYKLSGKQK